MASDLVPTEEEFDTLIASLGHYKIRLGQLIANEEVVRATQRLSEKVVEPTDNEKAFDESFRPADGGANAFIKDLAKEIDQRAIVNRCKEEDDKLTLLTAKVIRFRDECRRLGTDRAISDLLKP